MRIQAQTGHRFLALTHKQAIPLRRVGQPRDIAYAALYLASDEASWVTGAELLVDGGFIAT